MSLSHVVHRIASDESFASSFLLNPIPTLKAAGLELSDGEMAAIQALMSRPDWRKLCQPAEADIESYPWVTVQTATPKACSNT